MARVVALVPDLMFGSRVQSMLEAVGHEVTLTGAEDEARTEAEFADALVVDLTTDTVDGVMLVDSMRAGGELHGIRTLAFYSHVEAETRARAQAADVFAQLADGSGFEDLLIDADADSALQLHGKLGHGKRIQVEQVQGIFARQARSEFIP